MTQHSPLGIKAVLSASRISLDLGGSRVLDDVSTSFDSGLVTAVVGPNGAGKSSLIRVLAGIEAPSSGTLSWSTAPSSGEPGSITDWARMPRRERARAAALVEQDSHAELPLSVRAAVALGRTPHLPLLAGPTVFDETAITSALETAGVAHFAARELLTLSGGERQRVHLARALAQQPSILLLDEPTNHLDIRAQLEVLALVRGFAERGLTVIAALHDLNLAMTFADRIVVLDEGRVVASGTPASVLTPDLIMEVWGVTAAVVAGSNRPIIAFDLPAWDKRI